MQPPNNTYITMSIGLPCSIRLFQSDLTSQILKTMASEFRLRFMECDEDALHVTKNREKYPAISRNYYIHSSSLMTQSILAIWKQ